MAKDSVFERIAQGDGSAIRECMDRYGGLVWSLARRFSETASDAEDASQEIFLELWKSAHRYNAAKGSEAVFVATVARRKLIDRLRSSKRRPRTEELVERHMDVALDEEHAGSIATDIAAAERALGLLDPAQRQLLLMGIVEGMSHAEIAAATGKPLGTVKTQLRRGLIKIRALIEQAGPAPEGEDVDG